MVIEDWKVKESRQDSPLSPLDIGKHTTLQAWPALLIPIMDGNPRTSIPPSSANCSITISTAMCTPNPCTLPTSASQALPTMWCSWLPNTTVFTLSMRMVIRVRRYGK